MSIVNIEGLIKHLSVVDDAPFGLLSQQSSPVAGVLHNLFEDRLQVLFSAEHGWFGLQGPGDKADGVPEHPFWCVPVHSLYGQVRKPTHDMLENVKRVIVDLQCLGVRCYTYHATIKYMLEAAAEYDVAVTVLDRPIPLGGILDGPVCELAHTSFLAPMTVPMCTGMTPGEWAEYVVQQEGLDLDLTVIKLKNWNHALRDPWPNFMPPSPAIPSWDSAALYPATVFTEAYPALDCDRQGALSFRILGAPWMDVGQLLDDLSDVIPACGLGACPYRYVPRQGPYAGQTLDGILFSIENAEAFYPVTAGMIVFAALSERYPQEMARDARPEFLDKLCGTTRVRQALLGETLSTLFQAWIDDQDVYLKQRVNLYE